MSDASFEITVVIPAYNEALIIERTLAELLAGLRTRGERFEVVIVENGSTDGTLRQARAIAEANAEVRVVRLEVADYGNALREGMLQAAGELVVNFDCDYYDLTFLGRAVDRLRSPVRPPAMVVGSKRAPDAHDRRPLSRRLVTAAFSTILRAGFGLQVSDTHGMKAMHRAELLPVAQRCRFGRDLFDTELILRAERAGLHVDEMPVDVEERRPARTPLLRRIPRTVVGLARLWLALRRER